MKNYVKHFAIGLATVANMSIFAEGGQSSLQRFTGKVVGTHVRCRANADVESHIVRELSKNELLVVNGEKGDFYAVEAPADMKAYIFRSFVLDNVVEGNRVNVRIEPDRESPVIGHLSTGARIEGKICEKNNKWLEISVPKGTKFFVAKEFIEYAGGPELKATYDRRKEEVNKLLDSTQMMAQAEMRKPYAEINMKRLASNYETVINSFKDFPEKVTSAKTALSALQEEYLQKKISYLESKATKLTQNVQRRENIGSDDVTQHSQEVMQLSATDRMKLWEPVEESLFLSWSSMHHAKSIDDFYSDQKLKSQNVAGILESFAEPVKNRPGDYVLKQNNVPVAYLYSTQCDLSELVGKQVSLKVTERANNNFAHPAYYVLSAE